MTKTTHIDTDAEHTRPMPDEICPKCGQYAICKAGGAGGVCKRCGWVDVPKSNRDNPERVAVRDRKYVQALLDVRAEERLWMYADAMAAAPQAKHIDESNEHAKSMLTVLHSSGGMRRQWDYLSDEVLI